MLPVKQEVESYPWAVNHRIPEGFVDRLAAVSVSLFALYCCYYPDWVSVEMFKT